MNTTRYFIPGSRWAYFKLYTGSQSSDRLLTEHIHPFVNRLKEEGTIDSFFYLRYMDTGYHLRLRLRLTDSTRFNTLFSYFHEQFSPLVAEGLISDIQLCTYQRELERYGYENIELAEAYFCLDSQIVLSALAYSASEGDNEVVKIQTALYMIDFILSCFHKQLPDKEKIMTAISLNLLTEYRFSSHAYTGVLNNKYRAYRVLIDETLANPPDFIVRIAQPYRKEIEVLFSRLMLSCAQQTAVKIDNLTGILIHMCMNRLFASDNRLFELVLYYFLVKKYRSDIARALLERETTPKTAKKNNSGEN